MIVKRWRAVRIAVAISLLAGSGARLLRTEGGVGGLGETSSRGFVKDNIAYFSTTMKSGTS
jgi:hypothetical protein